MLKQMFKVLDRQLIDDNSLTQAYPKFIHGFSISPEEGKYMNQISKKNIVQGLVFAMSFSLAGCDDNPGDAVDNILVDVGGYISFKNPVEDVRTGTIVGGRPSSLAYYAPGDECFPPDHVRRHFNHEYLDRSYVNSFKGNVGFLSWGSSAITGGGSLSTEHTVAIQINGVTVEYLNAPDITRYYRNGMDDICKDYLDEFGFIVQAAMTDKLSIAIYDRKNVKVHLDETNISDYLTISGDMDWEIVNNYRVDINTPHYLGYHLGQLRKRDDQMITRRARSAENDRFIFEDDGVFDPIPTFRPESFFIRDNPETEDLFVPGN